MVKVKRKDSVRFILNSYRKCVILCLFPILYPPAKSQAFSGKREKKEKVALASPREQGNEKPSLRVRAGKTIIAQLSPHCQ